MTFVQILDCKTDRVSELNDLMDSWVEQTQGRRTATHATVGTDRADASHVVEIVEFPSYEEAMRNSSLPETDRIFREMVALCEEPPSFTDLDIIRDEQLNTTAARGVLDAISNGDLVALEGLLATDYRAHDPANPREVAGTEAFKRILSAFTTGFDLTFTVDDQMAEGDLVVTRWTCRGRHIGEFMGLPATDKNVEVTGTTIMRFKDGKVREEWWQWDNLGLLRQLGLAKV